jgi:hypothetical protein
MAFQVDPVNMWDIVNQNNTVSLNVTPCLGNGDTLFVGSKKAAKEDQYIFVPH